jgi:hypothetical protein
MSYLIDPDFVFQLDVLLVGVSPIGFVPGDIWLLVWLVFTSSLIPAKETSDALYIIILILQGVSVAVMTGLCNYLVVQCSNYLLGVLRENEEKKRLAGVCGLFDVRYPSLDLMELRLSHLSDTLTEQQSGSACNIGDGGQANSLTAGLIESIYSSNKHNFDSQGVRK